MSRGFLAAVCCLLAINIGSYVGRIFACPPLQLLLLPPEPIDLTILPTRKLERTKAACSSSMVGEISMAAAAVAVAATVDDRERGD